MDLAARRAHLIAELEPFGDHHERFQYVIDRAKSAPALPTELKLDAFLIEGCTSNLWLIPSLEAGRCRFRCDADSLITKGVAALVCEFYDGAPPAEVVNMRFAVQPDLPESRSAPLMVKTTLVTLSPILPELTPSDGL